MIKALVFIALLLIGITIFGAVIDIVGLDEIVVAFSQFSLWGIIPLLVFTVLHHVMTAVKWQYILRTMNIHIGVISLLKIGIAGYALGYITPVVYLGGEVFRGHALKERYNIPWQKSLSSIAIDKILESSVWIMVILAGVILYVFQVGISSFSRTIIVSGVLALFFIVWVIIIYVFSFKKKSLLYPLVIKPLRLEKSKGGKFLSELENDFFTFFSFRNKKNILGALRLAIIKNLFVWLRNLFLIYYLVQIFSYSWSIIAMTSSYLAYSLPIPGALGAHEAAVSFIFSSIGLSAGTGAAFTLLIRGADALMVIIGLVYLFKWGIGFFALKAVRRFNLGVLHGGDSIQK